MSLILEALRKSEAERRRGHMPDLHVELPPPAAPRVAAKPAWPWLAGSAAAVAIALTLWLATGARTRAAATVEQHAAAVGASTPAHAPALPPVAHLQPAATPVTRPAPVAATSTAPPPSAQAAMSAPPHEPLPPPVAMAAPAPGAAPIARPLPPPPPSAMPASSAGTVLTLADLAPSERKALPPLKLSMHMWNDDAAQRFVIVDGTRLGEGDRIGEAVVTSITRDGVLLDWNGRTLKVPLR
jgi:general secretion pathway protein B